MKKKLTIPSYTFEPTSDKNLFRVVDRNGDWTHYFLKKQKRFVPSVNHIIHIGFPKGERFYQWLKRATPEEAERRLKSAGEEGSRTHYAIRDLIDGLTIGLHTKYRNDLTGRDEILTNEEWDNLEAFTAWWEKYQPEKIIHEFSIAHEQIGFAGTPDFVGTILIPEGDKFVDKELWGKRILVLLDWKTSSGIWDEYKLQTAAYHQAVREKLMAKHGLDEKGTFYTGVLRVGTNHKCGYEMELWDCLQTYRHFDAFIWAWNNYKFITGEDETFQPKIREIPSEFKLKIKKEVKKTKKNDKSNATRNSN